MVSNFRCLLLLIFLIIYTNIDLCRADLIGEPGQTWCHNTETRREPQPVNLNIGLPAPHHSHFCLVWCQLSTASTLSKSQLQQDC